MKWRILGIVALLLAIGSLFTVSLYRDKSVITSPFIGKTLPMSEWDSLGNDQRITADSLRGQPFLLNVWGSWCRQCLVEHPYLMKLAREGVTIIGFNYKDEPQAASTWLARHGNPYQRIAFDPEGRDGMDLGVYGAPETFVVDAELTVVDKIIGPINDEIYQERIRPHLTTASGVGESP